VLERLQRVAVDRREINSWPIDIAYPHGQHSPRDGGRGPPFVMTFPLDTSGYHCPYLEFCSHTIGIAARREQKWKAVVVALDCGHLGHVVEDSGGG